MDYAAVVCLSVCVLFLAFRGWFWLARSNSRRKSMNRLDEQEWNRLVAALRTSAQAGQNQ